MIDYVEEPFDGLGANLFAKAAGRFLDMKIENDELDSDYRETLDKLLRFGDLYLTVPDDLPRRYLEQACFCAELLFTCYLHAPEDHPHRERYYAKGAALKNTGSILPSPRPQYTCDWQLRKKLAHRKSKGENVASQSPRVD